MAKQPKERDGTASPAEPRKRAARKPPPRVFVLANPADMHSIHAWWMGLVMGLLSLGLYLATFCWQPSSLATAEFMLRHLGSDYSVPLLDIPWDFWMRLVRHLPWLGMTQWTGLLCALLAAGCVMFLTVLISRLSFFYSLDAAASSPARERFARRLAAVTGACYLIVLLPFWWSGTHALPNTLSLFWLLGCALLFSRFQYTHHLRWLSLCAFLWGLGCAWNLDFWVLAPLLLFLTLREFFRWGMLKRFGAYAAFILPGLLGGAALLLTFRWSWLHGGQELYGSIRAWGRAMLAAQAHGIGFHVAASPIILVMVTVAFLPWWILFPLSHRSPWFYERGQVLLRLLLLGHLGSLLFNVTYAPWLLLGGVQDPYLLPAALLAACAGYVTGEFWCLSEDIPFKDTFEETWRRIGKRVLAAVALLAPLLFLGMGVYSNLPIILGSRDGDAIWKAANRALDERGERNVFFPDSIFDDALALACEERGIQVLMFRDPARCSPLYLRGLKSAVPPLADLIDSGTTYPKLMLAFLELPHAPESTVLLPGPEYVRNCVEVVPCGYAWHPYPSAGAIARTQADNTRQAALRLFESMGTEADGAAAASEEKGGHSAVSVAALPSGVPSAPSIARRELPFYHELADWRLKQISPIGTEAYCREILCTIASRYANDLAIDLARQEHKGPAHKLAVEAFRICPDNLAARLNAAQFRSTLAVGTELDRWSGFSMDDVIIRGLKNLAARSPYYQTRAWRLALYDGLVAAPEAWLLRGLPWAASGVVPPPDAFADTSFISRLGLLPEPDPRARWFQCACARIATRPIRLDEVCALMAADPDHPKPLVDMARTYLMQNRPQLAVALLEAANELLPEGHEGYPIPEILADAALAGLLPYHFPPHADTLDDVGAPERPHFPRRWVAKDGSPIGLRKALLQAAGDNPYDIAPWLVLWLLEPEQPIGRMAADKLRFKARNDPNLMISVAAALLGSGKRVAAFTAENLLSQVADSFPDDPVIWRLTYDAAIVAGDAITAAEAHQQLSQMLHPAFLQALIPSAGPMSGPRRTLFESTPVTLP